MAGANSFPQRQLASKAELPFEKNYYIKPELSSWKGGMKDTVITWFVQRDMWTELEKKGPPSFLKLEEREILYLKEE